MLSLRGPDVIKLAAVPDPKPIEVGARKDSSFSVKSPLARTPTLRIKLELPMYVRSGLCVSSVAVLLLLLLCVCAGVCKKC